MKHQAIGLVSMLPPVGCSCTQPSNNAEVSRSLGRDPTSPGRTADLGPLSSRISITLR